MTPITGFKKIESDQSVPLKMVKKEGALWIYMPENTKQMSIYHPELGALVNYNLPESLEKKSTYELVLGQIEQKLSESSSPNAQWLLIKPTPANANVYIDKVLVKSGEYTGRYKPGVYPYSVEAPLFHTSTGTITILDKNVQLNVQLEPAAGYIYVSSAPEEGAKVMIDGKLLAQVTPCKSVALLSGEHLVQVIKEFHQQGVQKISVDDDKTTNVVFTLQPNFATISAKSLSNATILVNGQPKGSGSWSGRLNAGIYTIEAHLDNYKSIKEEVELMEGETRSFDLKLLPITTSLSVNSTPSGAKIVIAGKDYGTTPKMITDLLVGEYNLQLEKEGYVTSMSKITLQEGNGSTVNSILTLGRTVKITTNQMSSSLMIDGVEVGTTPYIGTLSFGTHTISTVQSNQKVEKIITVLSEGGLTAFELNLLPIPKAIGASRTNIKVDLVFVKGGTFVMGSNGIIPDVQWSSFPSHDVTVGDFYMQTTEMTQLLWKSVMGSNPSKFQADDLPVDDVSWNVVQEFILKLNSLSGKKYRLPTEAEWEYAAGGGQYIGTKFSGTDRDVEVPDFGWTTENSNGVPHPVALKKPNRLGLYDMTGNVWEWCSDWLGDYQIQDKLNPIGPPSGVRKSNRGGSWKHETRICAVNHRGGYDPGSFNNRIGFRLVMSAK
jgi:formylglycine-generating enzyme required for sulfatase activity